MNLNVLASQNEKVPLLQKHAHPVVAYCFYAHRHSANDQQ